MKKNTVTRLSAIRYCMALDAVKSNADIMEVLTAMEAQLSKPRKASERKPNAETQERRERVLSALRSAAEALTCSQVAEVSGLTLHQANGALTALVKAEEVQRKEIKRTAYFSISSEDVTE